VGLKNTRAPPADVWRSGFCETDATFSKGCVCYGQAACGASRVMRILIADDEPLARRALVRMLRDHDDVEVVAECGEGDAALTAIDQLQPDLIFLDIRMPGLNGLGVASRLFRKFSRSVVFVTAHDSHALEAFDLNALDYLLKPFTSERLAQALERVRERTTHPLSVEALERVVAGIREREAQPRYMEREFRRTKTGASTLWGSH
jgi:two-component system, LytTR family, response regulator